MEKDLFAVVDVRDEFVLFAGSLKECETVLDEQYGGLIIVHWDDLTENERLTVQSSSEDVDSSATVNIS